MKKLAVILLLIASTNAMAWGNYCHNRTTGAVIPKPQFGCPYGWETV